MADRGGHKHKITKEQRDRILETFLEKGAQEAQSIATTYGLAPDYAVRLMWARGLDTKNRDNRDRRPSNSPIPPNYVGEAIA